MSTRNLDALFQPAAIALVGASNRPGSVGEVLARNLFGAGFEGPVMPVNPHETAIRSAVNYRSVSDLPVTPDLAVIATPAPGVPAMIDELGRRGCRAAVVISAGFDAETLRRDLLDAARPHLLRVVGPNCIGFLSPVARINASFVHLTPKAGDLAFVTQSGAVASAVLDWADARGIGFSHVVSIGDTSDVDVGDLLDHLALDPRTRAILLYVEAIGNARKFMTAARIAARAKPVLVIKAGRADAASDAVHDAAFRRAGMLRVESLRDLFEAVGTLASGLRPKGDRLAILTNGEGAGILAADALASLGGRLADLGPQTRERLAAVLPAHGSAANPVDTLRDASAALYGEAVAALLADPDKDAVLVLHCPQAIVTGEAAAQASLAAAASAPAPFRGRAPLLTCWLGERDASEARRLFAKEGVPTYQTPDESVRAFMQLVDYRRNQELLIETPPAVAPGMRDPEAAARIVGAAAEGKGGALSEPDAMALLAAYGIPVAETRIAASPAEAALVAARIGFPVALKILSPDIAVKSDVGGVRLELDTPDMVAEAADHMLKLVSERRPAARIEGFTVQRMVRRPRAREMRASVDLDPVFGPVVRFGPAGDDPAGAAVGLPPLNRILAEDMIGRSRAAWATGKRGAAGPVDAADVLVTLSQIIADFDEIGAIAIDPMLVDEAGLVALDARVAVSPAAPPGPRRARFAIQPYPGELARSARSRAGTPFRLRPIRPEDEGAVIAMIEASDPDDIRLRFFQAIRKVGHAFAARLTQIDYAREMAFVAEAEDGEPGAVLGVARLIMDPNEEVAEFGIMVRSDQKGRGLGFLLMNAILDYGRARGLRRVYGEVLAQNTGMLGMAGDLGFRREMHPEDPGLRRVVIDLAGAQLP